MIILKNKETGEFIGTITEEQLRFLFSELEEEYSDDRDYWLDKSEIDFFREDGADPDLLKMLENAIGSNDGIEIVWERT